MDLGFSQLQHAEHEMQQGGLMRTMSLAVSQDTSSCTEKISLVEPLVAMASLSLKVSEAAWAQHEPH
jgi:hypothetical protein